MLVGVSAVLFGLTACYAALAYVWPQRLAPPAISPLASFDLKLRFLRNHAALDPQILAVGSSITWRQLDGAAFERSAHRRFLNGATANLKIHQTRDLLEFYLAHYRNVRTVLVMVGPPDFEDCSDEPARTFDHEDAAAYVFGRWPEPYFYLRYFAPQRYAQAVLTLAGRQAEFTGDLFHDRYGSGPLKVPKSMMRGLRYGPVQADPACIDALIDLSHALAARRRHLVIVFPPLHPEYRGSYPEVMEWLRDAAKRVEAGTKIDGTKVVLLYDHPDFVAADFFDAVHLQWPSAKRLSSLIAGTIAGTGRQQPQLLR
jgi:hypothetical protein